MKATNQNLEKDYLKYENSRRFFVHCNDGVCC